MNLIYQKEILEKKLLPQAIGLIHRLNAAGYFSERFYTTQKQSVFAKIISQNYKNFENNSEINIAMNALESNFTADNAIWPIFKAYLNSISENKKSSLDDVLKIKLLNFIQQVTNNIEQKRISLLNSDNLESDKNFAEKVRNMLQSKQVILAKDIGETAFNKILTVENLLELQNSQPGKKFEVYNPFVANDSDADKIILNSSYLLERVKQNQLFSYVSSLDKAGYRVEDISSQNQDNTRLTIKSINPQTGEKRSLRVNLSIKYGVSPNVKIYNEIENIWSEAIYNESQLTLHLGYSIPQYKPGRLTEKPDRLTIKGSKTIKTAKTDFTLIDRSEAARIERIRKSVGKAGIKTGSRVTRVPAFVSPNLGGKKLQAHRSTISDAKDKVQNESTEYDNQQTIMQKKRQRKETLRQKQAVKKPSAGTDKSNGIASKNAITGNLLKWMGISSGSVFGAIFDPTGLVNDLIPFNPFNIFDIFS